MALKAEGKGTKAQVVEARPVYPRREPQGLIVHHDQDSVYTSHEWLRQLLLEDKVRVSYGERGAKVSRMESFWAHEKGEHLAVFGGGASRRKRAAHTTEYTPPQVPP